MRKFAGLVTFLLFIVLTIEILIFSPKETGLSPPPRPTSEFEVGENEQWIQGADLIETREGKKEWELRAERANSTKEKGLWILETVRSKFYSENDDGVFFVVKGDRGRVVVATKDMEVSGNVDVQSSNGYTFNTEKINYSSSDRLLTSDDPVKMQGLADADSDGIYLEGVGLLASLKEQYMDVTSSVKLVRRLKDGRVVTVRSEKARFFSYNRSAIFEGKVIVDIGAARITGPVAKFEYDSNTKALSSMEVEGGVNLSDTDKWATARKVKMSFVSDEFILTGSPKMVQNNEELVGEVIRFSEGGRKVEVSNGKASFESGFAELK